MCGMKYGTFLVVSLLVSIVPDMEKAKTMTLCRSLEHKCYPILRKKGGYLLAGEEINLNRVGCDIFLIFIIIIVIVDERSMTVSNSGRPPSYHEKLDR